MTLEWLDDKIKAYDEKMEKELKKFEKWHKQQCQTHDMKIPNPYDYAKQAWFARSNNHFKQP